MRTCICGSWRLNCSDSSRFYLPAIPVPKFLVSLIFYPQTLPPYLKGLTASMGASYSQMINASIQTVPVVGAAFSVGCMAMDASNIASTLNSLQKPSEKAVALHQVEESFWQHIPSTIQHEVEALLGAINDLKERQEEAQRNQQQDLIEQELEELNNL